jgi:hypothetical protein
MEKISKREFWLGMSLIALSMIVVNYIYPMPLESTAEIKIREIIECKTSNEGVVECG